MFHGVIEARATDFVRRYVATVFYAALAAGCFEQGPPLEAGVSWTLVLRHAVLAEPFSPLSNRPVSVGIIGERIDAVFEEDLQGNPVDPHWSRVLSNLDESVPVHDLRDHWILPGYIDAHVHVLDSAGLFTSPDDYDLRHIEPHEEERARIVAGIDSTLGRYLCSGVTTAVSMGGPRWEVTHRERLRDEQTTARLVTSGPFFANFPVGEFTLWTEQDPVLRQLRDQSDIDNAIEELVSRGLDLAKIGIAPLPDFTAEAFAPIVQEFVSQAHDHGLTVAAHAEQLEVAKMALRAGVDVLAHTVVDLPVDSEFIELALARGVVITSGLSSFHNYADVLRQSVQLLDIESRCGDPYAIDSWSRLSSIPSGERPPIPRGIVWGSSDEASSILLDNTKRVVDAGVTVAVGTNGGQIGTLHGPGFHRELQWLARAGLTNDQVITAATSNGALVFGAGGERGKLESGYLADLVVLTGDPRGDIRHLSSIAAVVRGGVLLEATELVAGPNP